VRIDEANGWELKKNMKHGGNGLEIEPWKMEDNWDSTMKLVETTIYIYIYILYDNDGMIDWILTIMMIISAKLKKSRHPRYVDQRLSKSKYTPCWTSQWHPQNKLGSLRSFTMIKSLLFLHLW
jgi:hypothetical protein